KILLLLFFGFLSAFLVACGSDVGEVSGDDQEKRSAEQKSEEPTNDTNEAEPKEEEKNEDVQEDESLKATNTFTNKQLGITGTVGPMKYSIPAIQLKKIEPKDQAIADLFEVNIGDTV